MAVASKVTPMDETRASLDISVAFCNYTHHTKASHNEIERLEILEGGRQGAEGHWLSPGIIGTCAS